MCSSARSICQDATKRATRGWARWMGQDRSNYPPSPRRTHFYREQIGVQEHAYHKVLTEESQKAAFPSHLRHNLITSQDACQGREEQQGEVGGQALPRSGYEEFSRRATALARSTSLVLVERRVVAGNRAGSGDQYRPQQPSKVFGGPTQYSQDVSHHPPPRVTRSPTSLVTHRRWLAPPSSPAQPPIPPRRPRHRGGHAPLRSGVAPPRGRSW